MNKLAETIDLLLKERGIRGSKMCDDLGISRSTITELRKGRSTTLKLEKAQIIADYFGVSVDYLLGVDKKNKPTQKMSELSPEDKELLAAFRGASPEKRRAILDLLK